MNFLKRLGTALATGYIFFFYSERIFWSFLRPDDLLPAQLLTWLLYSLFAYMFLLLVEHFKIRTLYALFVAGVVFGWLVEGIFTMTFFGIGGIGLPFSIVWTGVAWHALITVVIGWYLLQKSLIEQGYLHTLLFAGLMGLFWGTWGSAWALDSLVLASPSEFIIHAFITTAFLIGAFVITSKSSPSNFTPSWVEKIVLLAVALGYFIFVTVPTTGVLSVALGIGFGILYMLLRKEKKNSSGATILHIFESHAPIYKYLCILAMPIVASISYIGLTTYGIVIAFNYFTLIITSVTGVLFFAVATYKLTK